MFACVALRQGHPELVLAAELLVLVEHTAVQPLAALHAESVKIRDNIRYYIVNDSVNAAQCRITLLKSYDEYIGPKYLCKLGLSLCLNFL